MSTRSKTLTLALMMTAVGITANAAAAAATPRTVVVHPGESIQAAIDRAPAHGTVVVRNGTYAENLLAYATEHLIVSGTELDHNGKDGAISLAGHHTTYTGNRVHDNALFGLTIEDAPDASATITFKR